MKKKHADQLRFVLFQGILMLCVGAALSLLAEGMCNESYQKISYGISVGVMLTTLCGLLWMSVRSMWFKSNSKTVVRLIVFAGILMLVGIVALRARYSLSDGYTAMSILTGTMGLFWGGWSLQLASKLSAYPKTSAMIVIFGAISSVSGVLLCSLVDISFVVAVTSAACYSTWIGVGVLSLAPVLFWNWRDRGYPTYSPAYKVQGSV